MPIADPASSNDTVAPREGRVSRNLEQRLHGTIDYVAPREGRVSRNGNISTTYENTLDRRAPRGACE